MCNDFETTFDSTLNMLDSIICNREVLKRLQERGKRHREIWPVEIHLSADDFELLESVASIQSTVREVTKALSSKSSWVGDVLSLLTASLDTVSKEEVPTSSSALQNALIESLSARVQMLLGHDGFLPCLGGPKWNTVLPNESLFLLT